MKELFQFKPFLSKTFRLDKFHALSLDFLFWQLSLLKDPPCASLAVCDAGRTVQGLVGHLSLHWCTAAAPERAFS